MEALIKMLKNYKDNTYHPILYFESPLPGNPDHLIRFKSSGHRTDGFASRALAIASIEEELVPRLGRHKILKELDSDIEWDGE